MVNSGVIVVSGNLTPSMREEDGGRWKPLVIVIAFGKYSGVNCVRR